MKKFFISGREGLNTSIDMDNVYLTKWIKSINGLVVNNIEDADVIFSVWWNNTPITNKKTYISISNFINIDDKEKIEKFKSIDKLINPVWICPSQKQKEIISCIIKDHDRVRIMPFFVNEVYYNHYKNINQYQKKSKEIEVFTYFAKNNMLNLNFKKNITSLIDIRDYLNGKIKIGSFQRDSEGSDLLKAKWQKGPDNIVDWVNKSKFKNDVVFYLIGPRRHFIINELIKNDIEFIYFGDYSNIVNNTDDITKNSFHENVIFELYNLIDCYLVGSRLEGGPKSLIECRLTKTPVLTTNVGLSHDFVKKDYIKENILTEDFENFINEVKNKNYMYIKNFKSLEYNLKILEEIINENTYML